MLDSSNRGWDEQFVDAAWGEMRQLLDRELPVSASGGRRRRAMMLAAFFLFGLILGGVGIYFTNSPAVGYFPIPERAIALQSGSDQPASTLQSLAGETQAGGLESTPSASTQTDETAANKALITTRGDSRPVEPAIPLITDMTATESRVAVADTALSLAGTLPRPEPDHAPAGYEYPDPILSDLPDKQKFMPLEELMLLPAGDFERLLERDEQYAGEFPLPPALAANQTARLDLGAELGANYYQNPGYFGGLQVNYRMGEHWGLQSGLQYGQIVAGLDNARSASDFSKIATEQAQRDPSTGFVNNSNNQLGSSSAAVDYYNVDIRLQHLGLPLRLTYQLGAKWRVGAGVQAHYLLAAKRPVQNDAADQTIAAQYNISTYDRRITGVSAPDPSNRIDPKLFQKWNFGATLGAGFQPTDRWSFQLQYQYGLFNWLEADRFFLTPTTVQLSAVYRLNQ